MPRLYFQNRKDYNRALLSPTSIDSQLRTLFNKPETMNKLTLLFCLTLSLSTSAQTILFKTEQKDSPNISRKQNPLYGHPIRAISQSERGLREISTDKDLFLQKHAVYDHFKIRKTAQMFGSYVFPKTEKDSIFLEYLFKYIDRRDTIRKYFPHHHIEKFGVRRIFIQRICPLSFYFCSTKCYSSKGSSHFF